MQAGGSPLAPEEPRPWPILGVEGLREVVGVLDHGWVVSSHDHGWVGSSQEAWILGSWSAWRWSHSARYRKFLSGP